MGIRNTLAGILVAGALTGCQSVGTVAIPSGQAEQDIEGIIHDGIQYFQEGKTLEAQKLLEDYKKKHELSASGHCLLAVAYASNITLGDLLTSEGQQRVGDYIGNEFKSLYDKFKENPLILNTVQKELVELFETERYQQLEKQILGFTSLEPGLHGALFLLHLVQENYKSASKHAKDALELVDDKHAFQTLRKDYIGILAKLIGEASGEEDFNKVFGYSRVMKVFTD